MYDALTADQKRGLKFIADHRNANNFGGRTDWTPQQVAAEMLAQAADQTYEQFKHAKLAHVATVYKAMNPTQQAAVMLAFNLPPILQD